MGKIKPDESFVTNPSHLCAMCIPRAIASLISRYQHTLRFLESKTQSKWLSGNLYEAYSRCLRKRRGFSLGDTTNLNGSDLSEDGTMSSVIGSEMWIPDPSSKKCIVLPLIFVDLYANLVNWAINFPWRTSHNWLSRLSHVAILSPSGEKQKSPRLTPWRSEIVTARVSTSQKRIDP
jgi:hypothetical protein